MTSPYISMQDLDYSSTACKTDVLDAAGDADVTLDEGAWEIWATQNMVLRITDASGALAGVNGTWPGYHILPILVPHGATRYMHNAKEAAAPDGIWYANKITAGPIPE